MIPSKQPLNLSKQLHTQTQRIEITKSRIKTIWRGQSHRNKLLFGISTVIAAGLVLGAGQKYAASSVGYLRQLVSTFVLVSRVIGSPVIYIEDNETIS